MIYLSSNSFRDGRFSNLPHKVSQNLYHSVLTGLVFQKSHASVKRNRRHKLPVWGLNIGVIACCLLFVFACSDKKKSAPSTVTKSSVATSDTSPDKPIDNVAKAKISSKDNVAGSTTWHYSKTVDKQGRTVYKASITSPKLLDFEFPYEGGSVATLTIRKRDSDTHIYIQVSKGQFNRSFQGGKARVHFDKKPAVTYGFSAAENGSANIIFFDSEQTLIKQLKMAQTMVVEAEFAGQGTRQILFRTASLNWNY